MAQTRTLNDAVATAVGTTARTVSSPNEDDISHQFLDEDGVTIAIFRGTVDTDITGIRVTTSDGTTAFIHANTAGTAIVVTTTHP